MRKTSRVTIESFTYELSQFGAVDGRRHLVLFTKLLGNAVPAIVAAKSLDSEALLAVANLLDKVDAVQLEPLWEAFADNAWVIGKDRKTREKVSAVFDDHFAGEYFAMVQFFVESAKLNFADFLSKALAQVSGSDDGQTPTPSASTSPMDSTGTSGG